MTSPRLNLAFVLAALAAVVAVMIVNPRHLVDLGGNGKLIGYGIWSLLIGLAATHAGLVGIMWIQRKRWRPSEAGMFRFVSVKAIFWGATAYLYRPHDAGVTMLSLVLFVPMFFVTAHMDMLMVRRYIFGLEDGAARITGAHGAEDVVIYDGPERRGIWPGRRFGDTR